MSKLIKNGVFGLLFISNLLQAGEHSKDNAKVTIYNIAELKQYLQKEREKHGNLVPAVRKGPSITSGNDKDAKEKK